MKNLTEKLLDSKRLNAASDDVMIVSVDQTLTQDSTGTMVYLQLDALAPKKIATKRSVAYIDHNMLQTSFMNADDHAFIASACQKYGIVYSKPGNGICHQLHLENFAKPGELLIGSDSHTPTCGAVGMLAFGAGGLDVAIGMAKGRYHIPKPKVYGIELVGKRPPWVSAKDVILTILQRLSVKGGVGYIIEYYGSGLADLSITERATIANMGAELGATTSVFPSDSRTLAYFTQMGRADDYRPLAADPGATYDAQMTIQLGALLPMVAQPHSPDNVVAVAEVGEIVVNQVAIGSCTNSSLGDLLTVSQILRGKRVADGVSLVISPGSTRVLNALAACGALGDLLAAGARILELGCGPCIGMGQAPRSAGVSLRTFNRNFKGRCGTVDGEVYLVSPETAAVSALTGRLSDPSTRGEAPQIDLPTRIPAIDNFWVYNQAKPESSLVKGPNIKAFPMAEPLSNQLTARVLLKASDNITTDDIMPSGASLLPYRSNIPHLAGYAFSTLVDDFQARANAHGGGMVVAGNNYGQGSSREHAALVPLYLGVKAVIAKSFSRIHHKNLINAGIVPLTFCNAADYQMIAEGDELSIDFSEYTAENPIFAVVDAVKNTSIRVQFNGDAAAWQMIVQGGALRYEKNNA